MMSLETMALLIARDGMFSDMFKDRVGFRPGMGLIDAFAMEVEVLVKEDPEGEFWEKVCVAQSKWLKEYDEDNPYVSVADMEAEEKAIADRLYDRYVIGTC
tara:strand:+ start:5761 stop:6063 length:303 start_codon:yes stop_codon:yes gene_type:complete